MEIFVAFLEYMNFTISIIKFDLKKDLVTLCWWYSRVRNKHSPTLINFLTFFQGLRPYSGLHRAYFSSISIRYKLVYAYSFCQIFQGLCLFKGLRLFQTLGYCSFWIMYAQAEDFCVIRGSPTVQLTQILRNPVPKSA